MRHARGPVEGTARVFEEGDIARSDSANYVSDALTFALQRAIQALRDVRHLLPPDGVAIVDAILEVAPLTPLQEVEILGVSLLN